MDAGEGLGQVHEMGAGNQDRAYDADGGRCREMTQAGNTLAEHARALSEQRTIETHVK